MTKTTNKASARAAGRGFGSTLRRDFQKNKVKYLIIALPVLFYILFYYVPMYGALISFQDYSPRLGMLGSPWVGFKHFISFFKSDSFVRVIRNTFILSGLDILISFPLPILFAILLNEVQNTFFKRTIQTVSYMPHFISLVIACSLVKNFCAYDGLINSMLAKLGFAPYSILQDPGSFKWVYVISNVWQEMGWNSILFIAALGGINEELYEAAALDGAGRLRQTWHVTLPGIIPTIMIMLIMRIGQVLTVGQEKILLLYNPATYKTADVISTYIYRKGLQDFDWSYSSAVGLFNSAVNFAFLIAANWISRKTTETSLW